MAPYTPPRGTFLSICFIWMSIGYLIQTAYEEQISTSYIIVVVLGMVQKELRNFSTNYLLYCR